MMKCLILCLSFTFAVAWIPAPLSAGNSPQAIQLVNGGFESGPLHEGWTSCVYGNLPAISLDKDIHHEGNHSLRVTSDQPSDTAFAQELKLNPNQMYRLSGWIRTQDLAPEGAPVYGTLQIQATGGKEVLYTGKNHRGTADWTLETFYFQPSADGITRIVLFFVGFGKGTGTIWFDQITLEEIDADMSTWKVTAEPLSDAAISPFQYGQFIEYLCGLTPSIFAEKVFDGGFEGVPEYRVAFRKETDRIEQPWYPDGAVHRGEFSRDEENAFNGKYSQRISQISGDPCTLGISQSGIYVRRSEPLQCALSIRCKETNSPVTLTLWGKGATYASTSFQPAGEWQRFKATLTPVETDEHATLTISFRGPGSIWIDQVSLMPTDTVFGWRKDVAEALKALNPGIIRFGGSTTEGFDWKDTIGDPTRRVPFTTVWGGLEPGNAGLEEFVNFCQWVGAEPLICIRFTGRTPQDAADEVEYFNGAPESPMGKLRAANGHPEPYHVKYWQIGNELGDEAYQAGIVAFCKSMKEVDLSIKLLAAFPSPGLVRNASQYIDYICPHHYACHQLTATQANIDECRQMIQDNAPGRDIRLGITEWNTTAGDWGHGRAMLWTLDNALSCSRYHNLMHRNCGIIEIANRSNLADSFCSGIIQTSNSSLYKTPTYYAQQLYAIHAGKIPLKVKTGEAMPSDPFLDISATLSENRKNISLFVVNQTNQTHKRTLDLNAFTPLNSDVTVWTLNDTEEAGERDATNSWRYPERIRAHQSTATVTDSTLQSEFPALSLTVLLISMR
jgi:alpha-L-arabinofuranosidase